MCVCVCVRGMERLCICNCMKILTINGIFKKYIYFIDFFRHEHVYILESDGFLHFKQAKHQEPCFGSTLSLLHCSALHLLKQVCTLKKSQWIYEKFWLKIL